MTRTQLHEGFGFSEQPFEQQLNLAAGGLLAEQPRREHPGVVGDQQIAGLQQSRQITEVQIPGRQAGQVRRHVQETAGRTFRQGLLGNQLGGQIEMKIGRIHGRRILEQKRVVYTANPRRDGGTGRRGGLKIRWW